MNHNMFATISADIVASTSLSVNETIGLKQRIESLFGLLKVSYPDFEGRQIKGDYIECVMQSVSNVFRIAFIIKSCIKSFSTAKNEKTKNFHTYGIRMAKSLMWHTNISPQIYMPIVNEQKEKAANTLHIENLTL